MENMKELDFSKTMVVKSIETNTTVITNGIHDDESFTGMVINSSRFNKIGDFSQYWDKKKFICLGFVDLNNLMNG